MPDVYCPDCKAVYPEGTRECYRCVRPAPRGAPAVQTTRRAALLPVEAFADSHDGIRAVDPPVREPEPAVSPP